jgi:hypothetical protein
VNVVVRETAARLIPLPENLAICRQLYIIRLSSGITQTLRRQRKVTPRHTIQPLEDGQDLRLRARSDSRSRASVRSIQLNAGESIDADRVFLTLIGEDGFGSTDP